MYRDFALAELRLDLLGGPRVADSQSPDLSCAALGLPSSLLDLLCTFVEINWTRVELGKVPYLRFGWS